MISLHNAARTEELPAMNVLRQRRGRVATLLTVVAATALGLSACGSSSGAGASGGSGSKQLNLVGFSVIKSAYEELGTSFAKTDAGKGVTFKSSIGASG